MNPTLPAGPHAGNLCGIWVWRSIGVHPIASSLSILLQLFTVVEDKERPARKNKVGSKGSSHPRAEGSS